MDYQEALEKLRAGNKEYCDTHSNSSRMTPADRKYHVENGQHPYACIISCADSRVVPEHIFSVGLGALFTIRTAGNVIGPYETGSVEYDVLHLHTPLVVVMGHTHCGAVSAAIEGHAEGMVQSIVDKIHEAIQDNSESRTCEWLNAKRGVEDLLKSPLLRKQVEAKKLKIVAAVYDTESGVVEFDGE